MAQQESLPPGLTVAVPPELGQLSQLQRLHQGDTLLTAIPPAMVQLKGLYSLNLDGNRLTTLLPELGQLTQLKSFGLFNSHLRVLPPALGQLVRLTWLDLTADTFMREIPAAFDNLTELKVVSLDENDFSGCLPLTR